MKKYIFIIILNLTVTLSLFGQKIIVPMDLAQTDHLKSYGIVYWYLSQGGIADWLLNYRGGSFIMDYSDKLAAECRIRGVFFENLNESKAKAIFDQVQAEDVNMDAVKLEKAPKIAVYAPPGTQPWDDAVRLVLEYA